MPTMAAFSESLKGFYFAELRAQMNLETVRQIFDTYPKGAVAKVWDNRAATKYRRANGSTFIVPKWRTANVARGQGNRARRRMGWTAVYAGHEEWRWIPPKKKPRR